MVGVKGREVSEGSLSLTLGSREEFTAENTGTRLVEKIVFTA